MKFEWEVIDYDSGTSGNDTRRAKVWGGWLVKNKTWDYDDQTMLSESMTFIADKNHEWEIDGL